MNALNCPWFVNHKRLSLMQRRQSQDVDSLTIGFWPAFKTRMIDGAYDSEVRTLYKGWHHAVTTDARILLGCQLSPAYLVTSRRICREMQQNKNLDQTDRLEMPCGGDGLPGSWNPDHMPEG